MMMWLNTGLVEETLPSLSPLDRGLTLGDGVFETLAAYQGRPVRLLRHLDRLKRGCDLLGIPLPLLDFATAFEAVLKANNMQEAALRLTVTRGIAPRGILPPEKPVPTIMITAGDLPQFRDPACCVVATVTRRNEYSPLCRIKALSYLDNILALQEAVKKGGDEAIILNTAGRVAETSRFTLFIVKAGKILTPPLKDGALPGIARAVLSEKMPVIEQSLDLEDLYQAEEVFLTNSLGVRPVVSIDGKKIDKKTYPFALSSIRAALRPDF